MGNIQLASKRLDEVFEAFEDINTGDNQAVVALAEGLSIIELLIASGEAPQNITPLISLVRLAATEAARQSQ